MHLVRPQAPKNSKRTLTIASECAAPEMTDRCATCSAVCEAIPEGWIAIVRMPPSDPAMRAMPALRSSVMIDTLDINRLCVKVLFVEVPRYGTNAPDMFRNQGL